MTPATASGRLPQDPVPGTPEWDQIRRLHDEQAARLAKLHQMRSRLPAEIRDAEFRLRDHALRLGLDVDGLPQYQPSHQQLRSASDATLAVLPGRVSEIAKALGITPKNAGSRLSYLRSQGLVDRGEGYNAEWRAVE